MKYVSLLCLTLLLSCTSHPTNESDKLIRNGIPWFDTDGNIVNAHGACIVEDGGRYYLFGEWKSDESNAFPGFSCYSSDDLVTWKFENVVLGVQPDGILGPNRVGERVKVMKCPATGEYVMYMHADNMSYKDPHVGYATCKTIAGDYEFHGPLLFEDKPIRRWDMGTFQDTDGTGYLLIHHGIIYRLSSDYRSAEAKVVNGLPNSGESPAMFKKSGVYYLLGSGLTSWEKNDNFYFTAPSIEGPWTRQGLFAPEGSLTYYSQCTFVLPLVRGNDTIPMYMGDRWSFPHQASAATYVWMPMEVNGEQLFMPEYWECWDINKLSKVDPLTDAKKIARKNFEYAANDWKSVNGQLTSNANGTTLRVPFNGTRVAIVGESNGHSGYARIRIFDKEQNEQLSTLVDFYSKRTDRAVRFMSPTLPKGNYTLEVEVTGIIPMWSDKKVARYGSTDCFVTIDEIVVF